MHYSNISDFPINTLPPSIQQAVLDAWSATKAPLPLIVNSALSVVTLACQNSIDVKRPDNIITPCSQFFMAIADSGERKSTVDRLFTQSIREFENLHSERRMNDLAAYKNEHKSWEIECKAMEGRLKKAILKGFNTDEEKSRLREVLSKEPQEPICIRYIYNDTTPAAIKQALHEGWPSIGIISDEAGGILNGRAFSDLTLLNTLWDGGSIAVDRRSSESYKIDNVRSTISLMVQPGVFQSFMDNKGDMARSSGFLARFFVTYPYSTQGTRYSSDTQMPSDGLKYFNKRVIEIFNNDYSETMKGSHQRTTLDISPAAKEIWFHASNEMEQHLASGGYCSDIRDYGSKFADKMARLAAVFHYFEGGNGTISGQMMQCALDVSIWYLNEFKRLLGQPLEVPQEQKDADTLLQWLKQFAISKQAMTIKKNDLLHYGPNALRKKVRLDAALNLLLANGIISVYLHGKTWCIDLSGVHRLLYYPAIQSNQSMRY